MLKIIFKMAILPLLVLSIVVIPFAVRAQVKNQKEYQSVEYEFSVKYPENWRITDSWGKSNGVIAFQSPVVRDGDQPNAASIIICSQPLGTDLSVNDNCHQRDDHLSSSAKNLIVSRKKIKIDGVEAERIETKRQYENFYYYYVFFASKTRKFFITGVFRKSSRDVWDTFKYEPEFDNFLESIKLISGSSNTPSRNIKPVSD